MLPQGYPMMPGGFPGYPGFPPGYPYSPQLGVSSSTGMSYGQHGFGQAAMGAQGYGQYAYGGGQGSDQGYGVKGAQKGWQGSRGFGKGKGKGKGRGFGKAATEKEGGEVAEGGDAGEAAVARDRDPRWQIEMAQRKAKTRDRSAISQAQRSAQLRFEKDLLERVQGKWVDASDDSISYTVEGSLCSVASDEEESRVFRNRLSVYNGELCWDARRFWHYLDLSKIYAAGEKPENVEWNPGEGSPPTKQIIWNRAPPEPEVPPDVVRKGMADFQEKYNANDTEFCGNCYTDPCYVTVNGGKKTGGFGPFTTPAEVAGFLNTLRNEMGCIDMDFSVTDITGSKHQDTWTGATFTGSCDVFWVEVDGGWKIKRDKITATPKQAAVAAGTTAEAVAEAAVAAGTTAEAVAEAAVA